MREIKEALSKIREEWEYFEYPTGGVEIFEKESRAIIGMFYPTNSNGGFDGKVVAKYPEWLASLVSKVEEMQKTLEWYADEKNNDWKVDSFGEVIQSNVMVDDGERARQALKGDPNESLTRNS